MKTTLAFLILFLCSSANAQNYFTAPAPNASQVPVEKDDGGDSSRIIGHVYHVNFWGSAAISVFGGAALLLPRFLPGKPDITNQEFDMLQSPSSENSLNAFDRWVLHIGVSSTDYTWTAVGIQIACGLAPFALLFNDKFSKNWDDIVLMALEVNVIATSMFQWSPLGPTFQNRYRPSVYYAKDAISRDSLKNGGNRNSFFSGHENSAIASMYFMAKVYCDYNPQIEGWGKIGIYSLASIPGLVMGYFRVKALRHFPSDVLVGGIIGGVCGIVVPEIHRIKDKGVSLGFYSSPASTGVSLAWNIK